MSAAGTVFIYLLQTAAMGLFGAGFGAVLGVAMQRIFPRILMSFLPLAISTSIAWQPIFAGIFIGFCICILFALPPLIRFRRLSPLRVFRASVEAEPSSRKRDPLLWAIYAVIVAGVTAFSISQTDTLTHGIVFALVLFLVVGIFAGVAKLLIVGIRRFFPHRLSFVLRQGLANLYRPNNRTLLLTLSLGLGTFLLLILYLSREVLLAQFTTLGEQSAEHFLLRHSAGSTSGGGRDGPRVGNAGHPGSTDRHDAPGGGEGPPNQRAASRSETQNSGVGTGARVSDDLSRAVDRH